MRPLEQSYPNNRVLITGATGGLRRALALEFARRGWEIAVTDLDAQDPRHRQRREGGVRRAASRLRSCSTSRAARISKRQPSASPRPGKAWTCC